MGEAVQLQLADVARMDEEATQAQYTAFVDKFKPKLTTDDCYTPENVYDAVADWVAMELNEYRRREKIGVILGLIFFVVVVTIEILFTLWKL